MFCRKCKEEIADGSKYCSFCGIKQEVSRGKKRGNGTGSVYMLPNKTWAAVKTIGYHYDMAGKLHRDTVTKKGMKTKKDALNALASIGSAPAKKPSITFKTLFDKWYPTHKAVKSTLNCYHAAMNYFAPLWKMRMDDIDIDDLQACLDECPKGKRTKENMKALVGLMYKYAIPRHAADIDLGHYLVINADSNDEKEALPMEAVEKLKKAIGSVQYADYIVCECYLGFRPSEFLSLDCKDYDRKLKAFTGGAKTDAGKDRIVTVSPKIQPIIDRLTENKISGPVFCNESGGVLGIKQYRQAFYNALDAIGWDNPLVGEGDAQRRRYTPHSTRHTFATLMKDVKAPDKDKLELIGHTSTEMLRHYQDVNVEDLRKITDAM